MKINILFVTHYKAQCGVYDFGADLFSALSGSIKYNFIKAECASLDELNNAIETHNPKVVIYNYHPSVMPWICTKIFKGIYRNRVAGIQKIQLGIIHEVTEQVCKKTVAGRNKIFFGGPQKKINSIFDFYIAPDPTLVCKNPLVFKTGRLVPDFIQAKIEAESLVPVIGSFGFATPNKGFEDLIVRVQDEFEEAHIRINMPSADFGDKEGRNAQRVAEKCRSLITNPNISLEISHDFLDKEGLLNFIAGNSINAFFYRDKSGRGISSAVDNALAVEVPIAVTECPMFRHILHTKPSVSAEQSSLKEILANGFAPLKKLKEEWSAFNIMVQYEHILENVLSKNKS